MGGKYRLVDIPISNCLNSGLRSIYVLTQFNTMSLHRHIQASYKFDNFSRSFVDILAAQQTPEHSNWYQGTADAVRQNMRYFLERPFDYYIILSGDQLYRMDFRPLLHQHIRSGAEITLATKPVPRHQASDFGIMQSDSERRITRFVEKPKEAAILDELKLGPELLSSIGSASDEELFQASMGIYVFNRDVLVECLANDMVDFGKHIIPHAIKERHVSAYIFNGYWEDIGTIRAFYDANLDLTDLLPQYSFFDASAPIYTHPRFLPGSKINGAALRQAIIADGCIISDAHIERSVIGVRSVIQTGRDDSEQHRDGRRLLRNRSDHGATRGAADRRRTQLRDRSRDHRQERAHRRWRRHHAGRQTERYRRGKLLHPRRDRGGAEERGNSRRLLDLARLEAVSHGAELPGIFPFLLLVPGQGGFGLGASGDELRLLFGGAGSKR